MSPLFRMLLPASPVQDVTSCLLCVGCPWMGGLTAATTMSSKQRSQSKVQASRGSASQSKVQASRGSASQSKVVSSRGSAS